MSENKILIAYYSYSGNTKLVAEKIKNITGGEIFEIKTIKEYPRNYTDVVNLAKQEKEQDLRPELANKIDISNFDIIYLGTPVWWYTFATPIKTFLTEYDFTGKTIIPFCTHGGGGASATYSDMEKLCPNSTIKTGFTSYEHSAKDSEIEEWINNLK
ncbi:flavodoxin [bacterium]|nr:flavodoxin [bacterium]